MKSRQMNLNNPMEQVEGAEELAQCIYLLLSTVKGSDPLRPDFGSDLYRYLDKPLAEYKPLLVYAVTEAIDKWEKRVKVLKCRVSSNQEGTLTISLHLEYRQSGEQIAITVNM